MCAQRSPSTIPLRLGFVGWSPSPAKAREDDRSHLVLPRFSGGGGPPKAVEGAAP
jgi:hypothetical protein